MKCEHRLRICTVEQWCSVGKSGDAPCREVNVWFLPLQGIGLAFSTLFEAYFKLFTLLVKGLSSSSAGYHNTVLELQRKAGEGMCGEMPAWHQAYPSMQALLPKTSLI